MPCSPSKRSTRMARGMNPAMSGHHPPVKHRKPPVRLCPLCPADSPGPIYGFQSHRATGGKGQRCKPPVRLQQSQIIGRIHLNHFGVNQTGAREQNTH